MFTSVLLWMFAWAVAVAGIYLVGSWLSKYGTPTFPKGYRDYLLIVVIVVLTATPLLLAHWHPPVNHDSRFVNAVASIFLLLFFVSLADLIYVLERGNHKNLAERASEKPFRGWLVAFGRYVFVIDFRPTAERIQSELGLAGHTLWWLGWLHFVDGFAVRRDVHRDAKYRLNLYAAASPNANPLAFWTAVREAEAKLACSGQNNGMTLDATGEVQSVLSDAIAGRDGVSIRARITASRKYGRDVETVGAGAPWPWIDYSAMAVCHFKPIKWSDGGSVAVRLKAVTQPGSEAVLGILGARLRKVEWHIKRYLERLRRGGAGRHEIRADTKAVMEISREFARKYGFTLEVHFSSSPPPAAPPVVTTLVIPPG